MNKDHNDSPSLLTIRLILPLRECFSYTSSSNRVQSRSTARSSTTALSSMDLERANGGKKMPSATAPGPAAPATSTSTGRTLPQLGIRDSRLAALLLRASAVVATAVAAAVMGFNAQSYTTAVAVIGTKPLMQTFTAKFTDTPAFVYFVVANAVAGVYNLAVLLTRRLVPSWRRTTTPLVVRMLDMVITVLLATGAAAAASTAYLGRNGNLHARWNPVCDRFGSFCSRGGVALASSFVGVALMLALNLASAASQAPDDE